MPLVGEQILPRDLAALAYGQGWRDKNLIVTVAVCLSESGGYEQAYNDVNPDGSTDYGLWQINSVHLGTMYGGIAATSTLLLQRNYNAIAAYTIYKGAGYTFRPWVAYTTDKYLENIDRAILGVSNMWRVKYGLPPK